MDGSLDTGWWRCLGAWLTALGRPSRGLNPFFRSAAAADHLVQHDSLRRGASGANISAEPLCSCFLRGTVTCRAASRARFHHSAPSAWSARVP